MTDTHILVVDDEKKMLRILEIGLSKLGQVHTAVNGLDAIRILNDVPVNIVISDVKMPRMNGIDLLKAVKQKDPDIPFIVMTAFQDVPVAVEAMKSGAYDFLMKPIKLDELKQTLKKILKSETSENKNMGLAGIIGDSDAISQVKELVKKVSANNITVLITGESGTGKEIAARAIHCETAGSNSKPFVAVNTAAIPPELLESELFGHVKGAFTSAIADKDGKFFQANNGTIFLDEIADMSYDLQAKLLRVLEERTITPVGSAQNIELNLRVISATNRPLKEMVEANEFREDLYYRLNVVPIHLPPLRERREDIPELCQYFIQKYAEGEKTISDSVMNVFNEYLWPGNIRELENVIRRACVLAAGEQIGEEDIPPELKYSLSPDFPKTREELKEAKSRAKEDAVKNLEKSFVLSSLIKNKGNVAQAAKAVEMDRSQFIKLLKKHNIDAQIIKDSCGEQ